MKLKGMGGHMTAALLHQIAFAKMQLSKGFINADQFRAVERRAKAKIDERSDLFGGRVRMVRGAIREASVAA
jgi:hypothetical protein